MIRTDIRYKTAGSFWGSFFVDSMYLSQTIFRNATVLVLLKSFMHLKKIHQLHLICRPKTI
jgi:hypothetical protein